VDLQFDVTTDERPVKIVSIIDRHTRECLGGMVERSITGEDLIAELDRLAAQRGTYPAVLRCDDGPEPRRMPQSQQVLVAGPRPSDHQRLETRLQPPLPTFRPRLPTTEPLRCHLHSSMCVGMPPVG